jgi:hypothetical protein
MTRMQQLGVVTAVLFAAALSSSAADERYRDATPVITQYFDLISSGNYEIAGDMWTPEAIAILRLYACLIRLKPT